MSTNNKIPIKLYIISLSFLMLSVTSFAQRGFIQTQGKDVSPFVTKMGQTYYYLNNYYLDTVNFGAITDKVLINMIKELDPHSSYISEQEVKAMNEPLEGNFDGVGVEFALINDTLSIQAIVPGGPSEKVGIRAGDKIIKVDGEIISGTKLTIPRVHKYLRGEKGSKVNVSIARKGEKELLDFIITRDKIPLNSLDAAYMMDNGIFYLRLSRFSATSYKEIMTALHELKTKPNGIILDLRDNSGGYLVASLQIANEFLNKGELILYTEGRAVPRMDEYANGGGLLKDIPVSVLINENSASASEIVSGAIQDWDRGTIIGRRSFGKGLVQQQLPLSDGSQLRLTVARYHTPSGRVIQSHYEQGKTQEYYKQLYERFARGEQFSKDSIQFPDSLKYKTLRLGRTVYGGGGIMPDIFIPQDTSFYTPFYGQIVRKGLLNDYINEYVDKNRISFESKYKTAKQFESSFIVTDKIMSDFINYCAEKGVKPKENELETSTPELEKYFKGLIIRSLYGLGNFFEYVNKEEPEILKAVELLTKRK